VSETVLYETRGAVALESGPTVDLVERLEDSQMTLASIATNRYSAFCKEEVASWILKLSVVSEVIESWLVVQNMWMYMEAVFSGGDIVKQLPAEAKRFANIDKNYMKVVSTASDILNVVGTCVGSDVLKGLLPHSSRRVAQTCCPVAMSIL
jgi:dynein heavy chain